LTTLGVNDEHWLTLVGDLHVIGLVEVLSDTNLLAILKIEKGVARTKVKLDVGDDVISLCAIIGNHTLSCEVFPYGVLEARKALLDITLELIINDLVVQLVDGIKDRLG